jgi:LacI family transcriptional regulator
MTKSVTIYDIAVEAGVSICTVSRVVNGKAVVSLKTKNKVLRAVEKFKYVPSQTARSMVMKKSKAVGIVIPEIRNPFFSYAIDNISRILQRYGYSTLLNLCETTPEGELKAVAEFLGRHVDGLIFLASGIGDQIIKDQIGNRAHVVSFHSNLTGVDTINVMNRQAFFDLTEHLISLGHRDIACISSDVTIIQAAERINGYMDALKKHNIPVNYEYIFDENRDKDLTMVETAKKVLRMKRSPTAIMAINDYTAIDVYQAVSEMNMKVGSDIAVTGFDNTPVSALMNPTLTTVDSSTTLIAEIITDFLIKRMVHGDRSEPKEVSIPGKLIIRDSSTRMKAPSQTE